MGQQEKFKGNLETCKNLAELQGASRKEKDALQTFEDKCREMLRRLDDLANGTINTLKGHNKEMLNTCTLFNRGGNYSDQEVKWYDEQMNEINDMLAESA